MKRVALVGAAVVLLAAAAFAIARWSGRGTAQAERAAAQAVAADGPAAETPDRSDAPSAAGGDAASGEEPGPSLGEPASGPAEKNADGEKPLRLPPDIDLEPIVRVIERMAAGGPASRAQARELSLVLAKYSVPLPSALSDLVAAEKEQAESPTAEEIDELHEPSQMIANMLRGRLVTLPLAAPDELEAFYVELLATVARTSPSRFARMMAAYALVAFASPPREMRSEPRRWGANPEVAQVAVGAALAFALNATQRHSAQDQAMALWVYSERVMPGYLMLCMLADPSRKRQLVDPLVHPLLSRAEELADMELHARVRAILDKVLDDLRSHLGKPGSSYSAQVDRLRELQAFFDRMAEAINTEDKPALIQMMPPDMAGTIAGADSLRKRWGRMPDTAQVVMKVVGLGAPSETNWLVNVQVTTIPERDHTDTVTRVVEYRVAYENDNYQIMSYDR